MTKKNNKDSFLQTLSDYINNIKVVIGVAVAIFGAGFTVGLYYRYIEHKTEIIEIRQQYNEEITNLKLDYNNRIIELQNELMMMKLTKE